MTPAIFFVALSGALVSSLVPLVNAELLEAKAPDAAAQARAGQVVASVLDALATARALRQREQAVDNLDELTGSQPDGVKVVDAYVNIFGPSRLGELWQTWISWFADLATSGSTLSGELYLRSSRWDRSWICAALACTCLPPTASASRTRPPRAANSPPVPERTQRSTR